MMERTWSKWIPVLLVEMQNTIANLENGITISYKIKHTNHVTQQLRF